MSKKKKKTLIGKLTRIVSTANSHLLAEGILDVDIANAWLAERRGVGVGPVQFAVLALDTTNRLARSALSSRPLRLLVARWTGVGAHVTFRASLAADGSDDGFNHFVEETPGNLLNTRPTTEAEIVQSDRTVIGWESGAVENAIREFSIDTGGTRTGAGSGGGSRGGRGAWWRSVDRARRRRRGRGARSLLPELGRSDGKARGRGWGRGRARAGAGSAGTRRSDTISPLQSAIRDTLAGLLGGDLLAIKLVGNDGGTGHSDSDRVGLTLVVVTVSVVVLLGRHERTRSGEGNSNRSNFHRDLLSSAMPLLLYNDLASSRRTGCQGWYEICRRPLIQLASKTVTARTSGSRRKMVNLDRKMRFVSKIIARFPDFDSWINFPIPMHPARLAGRVQDVVAAP